MRDLFFFSVLKQLGKNEVKTSAEMDIGYCYNATVEQAHHKVGLGETPRHFIRKCRYSPLEKFEDALTALDLMQTKPSDAAFSAVFRT